MDKTALIHNIYKALKYTYKNSIQHFHRKITGVSKNLLQYNIHKHYTNGKNYDFFKYKIRNLDNILCAFGYEYKTIIKKCIFMVIFLIKCT